MAKIIISYDRNKYLDFFSHSELVPEPSISLTAHSYCEGVLGKNPIWLIAIFIGQSVICITNYL